MARTRTVLDYLRNRGIRVTVKTREKEGLGIFPDYGNSRGDELARKQEIFTARFYDVARLYGWRG